VAQRDAEVWADAVDEVVSDNRNSAMSNAAVLLAQRYTWRSAAESLDALVERLIAVGLVRC
jgi:enhancing lycopene biosynthesis protein 2